MIRKAFIHYDTFDVLCKCVIESGREVGGRGVVFSAVSKRIFVTKRFKIYAGNWYDVRHEISPSTVIGNPFTRNMDFKSRYTALYNRGLEGDAIDLLEGCALFEIEIVPNNVPEDVSGVREV
jgi:hypothetical protein